MTALRVMTWNVENLFLPAEEGGSNDESVFQHKLGLLAAVIDQEAPDVLALQEVGSEGALTALQNGWDAQCRTRR
jgi:exonuclease III